MDINQLRHPKETLYRTVCLVVGLLIWIPLITFFIFVLPFLALFLWLTRMFFEASVYGNAIHVNESQHQDLHKMKMDISSQLNLKDTPEFFIFNAEGAMNAVAIKFLERKFVLMFSSLVDLQCSENNSGIKMVLAHELAHHAAGHTSFWLNLAMKPAMFVPFLGAAYSRACELTADRIALHCVKDEEAAKIALVKLASGSTALASDIDVKAFLAQEQRVPGFAGFINEIYSTHPRMTKRIEEITYYCSTNRVFSDSVAKAA